MPADPAPTPHAPAREQLAPAVTLDSRTVEEVARRVAEILREERESTARRLVDAGTLTAELGVKRSWVYWHTVHCRAFQSL